MNSPKEFIRRTVNHGRTRWLADLPPSVTGKGRVRRFYPTFEDAQKAVGAFLADGRAFGQELTAWIHHMTSHERAELMMAFERIRRAGFTIRQAADLVEQHGRRPASVSASELAKRFLAEKQAKGCRQRHLRNLKDTVGKFLVGREELSASELTPQHVREYVNRNGWAPATRRSVLIDLRALFAFGIREKLLTDNPCDGIESPIVDDKPPAVLTVEQARRLLEACQRFDPGLLAFVALGLFGGLRREECLRLARDEIGAEFVEVKGRKAKTRQRRLVPVSAQLRAWLDAAEEAGATYPPLNFVRRFEALRKEAGLWEGWDQNVLRHSFVSYHYALHGNAAGTAAIAGHSETMLFRHYRALVPKSDAEVLFGLLPDPVLLVQGKEALAERVTSRNRRRAEAVRAAWMRRTHSNRNAPVLVDSGQNAPLGDCREL